MKCRCNALNSAKGNEGEEGMVWCGMSPAKKGKKQQQFEMDGVL